MSGRPTYSREIGDRICQLLREGHSLRAICRELGMPGRRTVLDWVRRDYDGFAARYGSIPRQKGAATRYTAGLAAHICDQLCTGRSLQQVCRGKGMPDHATVLGWIKHDRDGFAARYHVARELGCHAILDEMMEIVDDSRNDWRAGRNGALVFNRDNVVRARLRINVRRRLLGDAQPKTGGTWIGRSAGS